MSYDVQFAANAVRALKKLPVDVQRRVLPVIEALAEEPRPTGCASAITGWSMRSMTRS